MEIVPNIPKNTNNQAIKRSKKLKNEPCTRHIVQGTIQDTSIYLYNREIVKKTL